MSQHLPEAHKSALPLQRAEGLLLILDTPKGRGVFASRSIPGGTIVEVSPVLIFPSEQVAEHTQHTILDHYTYTWPSLEDSMPPTQAIALGLGSLFNHSTLHQNVGWKRLVAEQSIVYTTLRDIAEGEELCISYGGTGVLWFEDADAKEVKEAEQQQRDELARQTEDGMLNTSGLGEIALDTLSSEYA